MLMYFFVHSAFAALKSYYMTHSSSFFLYCLLKSPLGDFFCIRLAFAPDVLS